MAFGQQPTSIVAGKTMTPAVTVRILDSYGNPAPSTATVTLWTGSGAPVTGGSVAAVGGVATFPSLTLTAAGANSLTASASVATSATSTSFNVTAGPANSLSFSQQPSNIVAGAQMVAPVAVRVVDQYGNLTTATVSLSASTPLQGATSPATAGVATFALLTANIAGN